MIVKLPFPATLDDLTKVEGKAELIGGRIVQQMATGRRPNRIAKRIVMALTAYEDVAGTGEAFTDNVGFALDPPLSNGRESFSPDASFYTRGGDPNSMKLLDGPPAFAAEVRSEDDYGSAAERVIADKRAEYFEAGTAVVWDVDPLAGTIASHAADGSVRIFRAGDTADAEPALPGWRVAVDDILA